MQPLSLELSVKIQPILFPLSQILCVSADISRPIHLVVSISLFILKVTILKILPELLDKGFASPSHIRGIYYVFTETKQMLMV